MAIEMGGTASVGGVVAPRVSDGEIDSALAKDRLMVGGWITFILVAMAIVFFAAQSISKTHEVVIIIAIAGAFEAFFIVTGLLAIYSHLKRNKIELYTQEIEMIRLQKELSRGGKG